MHVNQFNSFHCAFLLQIWSYEFLRMLVPKNSYADPSVIPRGLKWARDSRGKKEGRKDLTTYRLFLDQLTKEHVSLEFFSFRSFNLQNYLLIDCWH